MLVVVAEPAHNRMLAWPGGAAGNMEVPARLVSARNAILMLPHQQVVQVGDVHLSGEKGPQWVALQRDLRRAHTQGFVDDVWTKFVAGDPEMAASLTAVTSVLSQRVCDGEAGGAPFNNRSPRPLVRRQFCDGGRSEGGRRRQHSRCFGHRCALCHGITADRAAMEQAQGGERRACSRG